MAGFNLHPAQVQSKCQQIIVIRPCAAQLLNVSGIRALCGRQSTCYG